MDASLYAIDISNLLRRTSEKMSAEAFVFKNKIFSEENNVRNRAKYFK
jgi:hypothetical protein